MEFRAPTVAAQQNAKALNYLTKNLKDPEAGRRAVEGLIEELGNAVDAYPDWHPILTAPPRHGSEHIGSLYPVATYAEADRQSVVQGKCVAGRVHLGGCGENRKKQEQK